MAYEAFPCSRGIEKEVIQFNAMSTAFSASQSFKACLDVIRSS